jgi:hypothetical protein
MQWLPRHDAAALACLLALFVCRTVIASAIVPPWQGPDEPAHVILAYLLSQPFDEVTRSEMVVLPAGDIIDAANREVQRTVLRSMARHGWWESYGTAAPDPLPTAFSEAGERLSGGTYVQPLYYGVAALVLRVAAPRDIETVYAYLRVLSIIICVATIAIAWAGTRLLFGSVTALGATAIAALHPQFLLTAISVNPDTLAALLGAFLWWQAARALTGRRRQLSLMLIIVAAAAAVLTKRSAVPLACAAAFAAAAALAWRAIALSRRQTLLAATAALVGVTAVAMAVLWFDGPFNALVPFWRNVVVVRRPLADATVATALDYSRTAIDYAWFIAGWQRFPAPEAWLAVARGITICGILGAIVAVMSAHTRGRERVVLAWSFVLVQVAAIVLPGFWSLAAPQGRYLFPVLAPMTVLLWLGVPRLFPRHVRYAAGPILLAVIALLDVFAFTAVLMPAYVPFILHVP